jgi:hypothetical protein
MESLLRNIRELKEYEFGLEGIFFSKIFNKDIRVAIDEDSSVEFAESCIDYFNSLSENIVDDVCAASIRYCNDFLEAIGQEAKIFKSERDVLQLVYPSSLIVPYPEQGEKPVVRMELNCEWEVEHGMEIIIRDGQLLYLGAFNGEDPWYDYESEGKDSWNYA